MDGSTLQHLLLTKQGFQGMSWCPCCGDSCADSPPLLLLLLLGVSRSQAVYCGRRPSLFGVHKLHGWRCGGQQRQV